MDERRKDVRDKVLYGGVTSTADHLSQECIVRNISKSGAQLEFKPGAMARSKEISLTIARTGGAFVSKIIWLRDNIVGVAFTERPVSDIAERLRISEQKKRKLEHRINQLLDQ